MAGNGDRQCFPALRALMGDWVYYVTLMPMGEIANRVSVVDDIHSSKSLKEELQRALTKNAGKIATYLQAKPQRFFNALVIGTYGGNPKWREVTIRAENKKESGLVEGIIGYLEFDGSETLFAIDGQHRVRGIKEAIEVKPSLAKEEVAALFVKGVTAKSRERDPGGFERTRRLFSTLNRYAKPVQKRDMIALDEDDVVAIVTRRLLEEHPLLIDKVAMNAQAPLRADDEIHFTSLVTVYNVLDVVLRDRVQGWEDYKRERPEDDQVELVFKLASSFFTFLAQSFSEVDEMRKAAAGSKVASRYRNKGGGHLLFRPLGLSIVGTVMKWIEAEGVSRKEAIRRISEAPMALQDEPWKGLLWDTINQRMYTSAENKVAARKLLFYMVGGDLGARSITESDLKEEIAGVMNLRVGQVQLPKRRTYR